MRFSICCTALLALAAVWSCSAWLPQSPSSSGPTNSWDGSPRAKTSTPAKPKNGWERWASRLTGADPLLLGAVCGYETRGERVRGTEDRARSKVGALGRCQVMPATAAFQMGLTAETLTPAKIRLVTARLQTPAGSALHGAVELAACQRRYRRNVQAVNCYRYGPHSDEARLGLVTEYAKNVLLRYAVAKLREQTT